MNKIPNKMVRFLYFCDKINAHGALAQLGERMVRNHEVAGSIPVSSSIVFIDSSNPICVHQIPFLEHRFLATSLSFHPMISFG